jgi:hypothetical protein
MNADKLRGMRLSLTASSRRAPWVVTAVFALLLGGSPAVAVEPAAAGPEYLVVHFPAGDHRLIAGGVEAPFVGEDTYGRFAWVPLAPGASSVAVRVVDVSGAEVAAATVDPSRSAEVWLKPGDARASASRAAATGVVTVHYGRAGNAGTGWGLHLWGDGGRRREHRRAALPAPRC